MTTEHFIDCGDYIAAVIRTRRVKTIGIRVKQDGVTIRVPQRMSLFEVKQQLQNHHLWIQHKRQEQAIKIPAVKKQYCCGESYTYLGVNYRLHINEGAQCQPQLIDETLQLTLPRNRQSPREIHAALTHWYRQAAKNHLCHRVAHFAPLLRVNVQSVKVRRCKSRWGSCSLSGNINFNWLLIMADAWIVDYVVVHELCHLIEHNHSSRFWQLVETQLPHYRDAKTWLNTNGYLLQL